VEKYDQLLCVIQQTHKRVSALKRLLELPAFLSVCYTFTQLHSLSQ